MYNTSRRSSVLTALAWLVPHETAAVSMQVLCTAYNHVPCHFMQSHINRTSAGVSLGRAALRGLVTLCRTAVCRDVTLHAHSNTKVTNVGWLAECCFTSTETVGLLGTGAQDVHLDFHTASVLCASIMHISCLFIVHACCSCPL